MLRLNLGAGDSDIPGFIPIDRSRGQEVWPLAFEDNVADVIRASHVLEHFSHRDIPSVLQEWARVLKPGGVLKVAVPDFQTVAEQYLAGASIPVEGYVMGGHIDSNDHHGALFDEESLRDYLSQAGLIATSRWESEIQDCASLPISLNLQAWKPPRVWPKVSAVMSVPRLGFIDTWTCSERALTLGRTRIGVRHVSGAFWGQCLTRAIEETLDQDSPDYILTLDYDSLFTATDVMTLVSIADRNPEVDVLAPVQVHRKDARPLFVAVDDDGNSVTELERSMLSGELLKVRSAHFGLTLIRSSVFERMARPWFHGQPDDEGGWGDGRTDDDVWFWRQLVESGLKPFVSPRVSIGHLELVARWPDKNLGVLYQHPHDFQKAGKPEQAWR